ncbi:RNA-directed DNA polymerase from mobile element jockey [Mycena venus]|uniref:RNA-directed DNA polymerase from mobile element jockey n=1 Tax=Mycena venus TaxID=2733690 RepID=A0A8H6XK94_9AGAR|nr:RNA-directed DNA polymerase from mobile element jockey [Mycena venus]
MACGAYEDDCYTAPSVPTQPSSPTNSGHPSTEGRPGPTIVLPPLKDRPVPSVSLFSNLKKSKGRKGIHAGDSASPSTWNETMDAFNSSTALEQAPGTMEGQMNTDTVPVSRQANATAIVTPQEGPLNTDNDSPAAASNGTDATAAQEGSLYVPIPSSPTSDAFMAGVANHEPPPSPRILASAAPSTTRSMHKQTDKSFDARTGVKAKSKATGNPLDSAPKGFLETDLVLYNHIGLAPPSSNDSAAKYREKAVQNEMKLVQYMVSLERGASASRKENTQRLGELSKILADVKSSTQQSLNTNPDFLAVHKGVAYNRATIESILDALPTNDFYDSIGELTETVEDMRKKADEAEKEEMRKQIATLRELAHPSTAPGTAAAAQPLAAPAAVHAPGASGTMAHATTPTATGQQQQPVGNLKRPGPPKFSARGKQQRADNAGPLPGSSDIIFGPIENLPANPTPAYLSAIASAAVAVVLRSATATGQHAAIGVDDASIRFKSRNKAGIFTALVERFPPIAGQSASFRAEAATAASTADNEALLSILRGGSAPQMSQRHLYNSLRIITWNIHGDLAIKITQPHIIRLINANDIVIFQETWLRPEQEHLLALPKGFEIIARSRGNGGTMRGSKGGVAVVLCNNIPYNVLEDLSGPDLIALELERLYLIGAYVLPSTNNSWWIWTDVHPKIRFAEALAWCAANRRKPVAGAADLNGRTGSDSPPSSILQRSSMDEVETNTRGTWILNTCEDSRMEILNGTRFEASPQGAFTSFQPGGMAVVDYALFSCDFLDLLPPNTIQIVPTPSSWSDHAILALHVTFPTTPTPNPPNVTLTHALNDPDVTPRCSPTPCDKLAQETIEAGQSDEEATLRLYGTILPIGPRRTTVHIASSCKNPGRIDARAAFGLYWGDNSRHNRGWCIPGRQLDGRAMLIGILWALGVSNAARPLEIYTTSKYAIRGICYSAGKNHTRGWDCANGDLFERIADTILQRTSQISFHHISQPHTNTALSGARKLAHGAISSSDRSVLTVPDVPKTILVPPVPGQTVQKVVTSLPKDDPPKPKAQIIVTAAQLAIGDKPDAHRNRLTVRRLQSENLNRLLNAETIREWWEIIRGFTDKKPRDARVTAEQLRDVFRVRLNPPAVMPSHFDADLKRLRDLMSAAIPSETPDHTDEGFFSRPFELPDIEKMKRKLRSRSSKSARGIDQCSYKKIQSIPDEALLKLFNYCVKEGTGPQDWFTTILVGLLKLGKPGDDPDSYRLVGLECCLLKCLTLLIDMRIRAWAESRNILPDSQNGFREKYRTHNNSFILRCSIDRARAKGKPLYVAFLDLTNAFPSTDLPTLWMKLYAAGVSGPLFDWLRMLYARMSYVVRQGSVLTAAFKSLIGVLTGDTASPILWNIYFADLADVFDPDPDDICLNGRPVSHLEQADDVVLFSTTAAGLQRKIDRFFGWCKANFMVISATKTEWMLFGELPPNIPIMTVGETVIKLVKSYKFVGVLFTSTDRDIFAAHYAKKASKARAVANTTFAAKSMIGCLPPPEGIRLYMARINPHLTFGCKVCLDVVPSHLAKLTDVQHEFIRRLLGVNSRSILTVLFTETGIIPLSYRRVALALGYLIYLLTLPAHHLANAAYLDSLRLAQHGHPCWLSDLRVVLLLLPVPVQLSALDLSVDGVNGIRKAVDAAGQKWLNDEITAMSSRLPLIQGRLERNENRDFVSTALKLRQYLRVPVPAHRKALTRLLLSSHTLGIEILRWKERLRARVPRESRFCRFCRLAVESEGHAMLGCTYPELVALRYSFLDDIYRLAPDLPRAWVSTEVFLRVLLQRQDFDLVQRLAKYTFDVFAIYATCLVFRPAEYLYNTLE